MDNSWQALIDLATQHACRWSKTPTEGEWGIHHLDTPPHNRLLGPVFDRGDTCGLVAVDGRITCQWGDTDCADMTFSVTKSYLAMVAGIAFDQGLISDLDEPVAITLANRRVTTEGFTDNHNKAITWRHFLNFTSEWSGECFGVPDQVDHYRTVSMQPAGSGRSKGQRRNLSAPGTHWEYNDVRINQFSLVLMRLFGKPLPEIFARHFMQPLGTSNSWHWHGYDNSWVDLGNGEKIQSVPGGGHWGGGMVISASDQLLLAKLMLDKGVWQGSQLLSTTWINEILAPCRIAPWYGGFFWLNTNNVVSKAASPDSYFAMGIGGQLVWHDPISRITAVFRWIDPDYTERLIETCLAASVGST